MRSLSEVRRYLRQDLTNLDYGHKVLPLVLAEQNGVKLFMVVLRICEFLKTNKIGILFFPLNMIRKRIALSMGFSIPLNVCGPGLSLPHLGPVIINGASHIGSNVRIHSCVVIGGTSDGAPCIGNNVYIGPGAKIFGKIIIGDNVVIGANSVVNKNVPSNCFICGVPSEIKYFFNADGNSEQDSEIF